MVTHMTPMLSVSVERAWAKLSSECSFFLIVALRACLLEVHSIAIIHVEQNIDDHIDGE